MVEPTRDRPLRVAFLLYPGCLSLDVIGPMEVFHLANLFAASERGEVQPLYDIRTYGTGSGPLFFSSGLQVVPGGGLSELVLEEVHTLMVPGGWWPEEETDEVKAICALLREADPLVARVASVCTGSFFLAQSGLLNGREATTHWSRCAQLQRDFPEVSVQANAMYVSDGHIYTAAGVSAGIDLALSLVEEDLGALYAQQVARYMVLFLRRQGGQSQFSAFTQAQPVTEAPIQRVQEWVAEHLDGDLRVDVLAKVAHMSPRHFARVFKQQVGVTPARFVERARVEAARSLLEQTPLKLTQVALMCGFRSDEVLRRVCLRYWGVSPGAIRDRFRLS